MRLTFWRRGKQEDLRDELHSHLEMAERDRRERGESADVAAHAARREFGNVGLVQQVTREQWGWTWLGDLLQDLRYGARMLRKNPAFSVVAVLTLALGIGSNTAIFSLADAFLLKLLPVQDPQQLVFIRATDARGGTHGHFPYPTFERFRDDNSSFAGMFAWDDSHVVVTIDGQPEFVDCDFVSGNYFDVLGAKAFLGRTFTTADDQPNSKPLTVISYSYWERRFGRSSAAIGKNITVGRIPFTIVGITTPNFSGRNVAGRPADFALPMAIHSQLALGDHDTFEIMARLKPGISADQARAELDVIYKQFLRQQAGTQLSTPDAQEIAKQ